MDYCEVDVSETEPMCDVHPAAADVQVHYCLQKPSTEPVDIAVAVRSSQPRTPTGSTASLHWVAVASPVVVVVVVMVVAE